MVLGKGACKKGWQVGKLEGCKAEKKETKGVPVEGTGVGRSQMGSSPKPELLLSP